MADERIHEPPGLRFIPLLWRAVVVLIAACTAVSFARNNMATLMGPHDDEGYLLISLYHYLKDSHLYTTVASQYGPFYYFFQSSIYRLFHLTVSMDSNRMVAMCIWLLSAGFGAGFVRRISGNLYLAAAAGLALTIQGRVIADESGHPQQLVFLLLLVSAYLSTLPNLRIAMALLGAVGAALLFTKINVGVFYLVALGYVLVCRFPHGRLRSLGVALMTCYAVGMPVLLMGRTLLHWGRGFCILAILSGLSAVLASNWKMPPVAGAARDLLTAMAATAGGCVLIVLECMREGIVPGDLLRGVLLGPAKLADVLSVRLPIVPANLVYALGFTGVLLVIIRLRPRLGESVWFDALRCIYGIAAVVVITRYRRPEIGLVMPLLPLGVMGSKSLRPADYLPRVFVTVLAATEFLQAFPVAASQVAIGAAPLMPWAFVCIYDGGSALFDLLRVKVGGLGSWMREAAIGSVLTLSMSATLVSSGACSWSFVNPPSRLPGSASVHLPASVENRFQELAGHIHANCSALFSMPGMGSLNFWSDVPTPNGLNLTNWVKGFTLEQQRIVMEDLKSNPNACVMHNPERNRVVWQFKPEDLAASPLATYILTSMPKVYEIDGFEVRVNPRRSAPWTEPTPLRGSGTSGRASPAQ